MDGLIGLSVGIMAGFCENGNEPSDLISGEDCFHQLSYCQGELCCVQTKVERDNRGIFVFICCQHCCWL